MENQMIFRRYELKYLLSPKQLAAVEEAMQCYMQPDSYFQSSIRSLYFDTDNYRLIRHSIEHPVYKEKLRLRSYGRTAGEDLIFAELKKKYQSVVYKRRIQLPLDKALRWIGGGAPPSDGSQIEEEIDYFIRYYKTLAPAALITYDRRAYRSRDGMDLRMTFDTNVLARTWELSLDTKPSGVPLLAEGKTLLEIKTGGGMPLWLTDLLCRNHIYKSAYSKYGTAYQRLVYPACTQEGHWKGGRMHA